MPDHLPGPSPHRARPAWRKNLIILLVGLAALVVLFIVMVYRLATGGVPPQPDPVPPSSSTGTSLVTPSAPVRPPS